MTRPTCDGGTALLRALRRIWSGLAVSMEVEEQSSRDWTSITFSGARHRLRLRLEGKDAAAAADRLGAMAVDGELELGGHWLADLAIRVEGRSEEVARVSVEALTVDADWD